MRALTVVGLFIFFPAWGDAYDLPKVVALQDRQYNLKHDISLYAGLLPSDAFNKGYTLGGGYTYYFQNHIGWEVIQAHYSFNSETNLKKDLRRDFNAEVQNVGFGGVLDYIVWYWTTNFIYTPFYNKSLLFNRSIVHGDTSVVIGAGSAHFKENGARLLLSGGLILRFFSSEKASWKLDIRNHTYFESSRGAIQAMAVHFGYSRQLGVP